MHLRYDCMTAGMDCGENRHPLKVIKELGITYQHATPQSLFDQWWLWNCQNIPKQLPKFIDELKIDPIDAIGHGLTESDADAIKSRRCPPTT